MERPPHLRPAAPAVSEGPSGDPLVQAAIAGDRQAREALWVRERRLVAGVILSTAPSLAAAGDDLEDVVQEVAVRFVRGIDEVAAPAAFRGWLRTVARSAALDAGRKVSARRRSLPEVDGAGLEPDAIDPDAARRGAPSVPGASPAADGLAGRVREVLAGLDALPEHWREVLWMKAVRGLTQAEIAGALGVAVSTVESRLARARRAMRGRFGVPEAGRRVAARGEETR